MKARSLKAILQGAAHPNTPGSQGRTPLHRVARRGCVNDLKILLENGGDVDLGDDTGERPLQMAGRKGHLECVKMLIQAGANINHIPPLESSAYSESTLCSVARSGRHSESLPILLELLRAGADPNAASSARRFPLHAAARCGNLDIVRALLEAGAKQDVFDNDGRLPLHCSLNGNYDNAEMVELLLQFGSDVNAPDENGAPPVFYTIDKLQHSPNLLRTLINAHPDLSLKDQTWGLEPLALARRLGIVEIASVLQEAGAPEPALEPPWKSAFIVGIEDAARIKIEVSLGVADNSEDDQVNPEDQAVANEAVANAMLLPLQSPYGWKASRSHWELLSVAQLPMAIARLAYFARGRFNRPAGKELEDGPAVLGESYFSAIERFLNLGLLEKTQPAETLACGATVQQLKDLATTEGLKSNINTKSTIIASLVSKLSVETMIVRLGVPTHYHLAPAGKAMVANKDNEIQVILKDLTVKLCDYISVADFRSVWNTLLLLQPLAYPVNISHAATASKWRIKHVRRAIHAAVPDDLTNESDEVALWKTWAVLIEFGIVSTKEWPFKPWANIPHRCLKDNMTPGHLVNALFGKAD
jgi:ankyrin repeat protein